VDEWHPVRRDSILSLEEIARFVRLLAPHGVEKVRLTGGEPLLRKNICQLVDWLAHIPGIREVAMTTNGHLLSRFAEPLYQAGLTRLTVSIDTFDTARFQSITGGDLERVLHGLEDAGEVGFENIGINVVGLNSVNRGQLAHIAQQCWGRGWTPRFIELMPIGNLPFQSSAERMTADDILSELALNGEYEPEDNGGRTSLSGPARYYRVLAGSHRGQRFGVISPMTDTHFCKSCNRARLTAQGGFRGCLGNDEEVSLLSSLREGLDSGHILGMVRSAMESKKDAHRMSEPNFVPLSKMIGLGG